MVIDSTSTSATLQVAPTPNRLNMIMALTWLNIFWVGLGLLTFINPNEFRLGLGKCIGQHGPT